MNDIELDERWDWVEVTSLGGPPEFIKGRCRHRDLVDVELAGSGEVVRRLCLTCDAALPPAEESA